MVIIGGGFSGINTALELAEKGITNIAILEGRYLGYGGTGRNGGQVMAGIGHDLEKIKRHVGPAGLETIFKISNLGAGIIRERIKNMISTPTSASATAISAATRRRRPCAAG